MSAKSGEKGTRPLLAATGRLLVPLVRLMLKNGVAYRTFVDIVKKTYVDVAEAEFRIPGRKQSVSRISVVTGIRRKDVTRVLTESRSDDEGLAERHNRVTRIIAGWRLNERFTDKRGHPASLPFEDAEASFSELVRLYGSDVPARATLDELLRVGAVENLKDGRIRLVADAYIPVDADKVEHLASDVADLISSVDHNLSSDPSEAFFQRKVEYDNLPAEFMKTLRKRMTANGQALLEDLDREMAEHDRDMNPSAKGSGRKRAMIGLFYFEQDVEEDELEE